MSQSNTGQAQAAETLTQETKTFIRQVRTKTRRKYAPEDKIRIVLEGFRSICSGTTPCGWIWRRPTSPRGYTTSEFA